MKKQKPPKFDVGDAVWILLPVSGARVQGRIVAKTVGHYVLHRIDFSGVESDDVLMTKEDALYRLGPPC
jgi:hypothetical protein